MSDRLGEEQFAYAVRGNGDVAIAFHGRTVTTLRGPAAARFLSRVGSAGAREQQLEMARATGNFKRGNERRDNS